MRFRIESHRPGAFPAWIWVAVALAMLLPLAWLLRFMPGDWIPKCQFKLSTGHPCPGCGTTRMLTSLSRGSLVEAFRWHPLGVLTIATACAWVAIGSAVRLTARDFYIELSPRDRWWLLSVLVCTLILNWIYLWVGTYS